MRKKFHDHCPILQTAFPIGYQPQFLFKKQPLRNFLCSVRLYSRFHFLTLIPVDRKKKMTHSKLVKHMDTLLALIAIALMLLSGIWTFLIQLAEFGLQ